MTSSNNIGPIIAASARLGMGYADRMLTGIESSQFSQFAQVGGTVVESNHPCFILGHLSLYAPRIVGELGGDTSSIEPSDVFVKHFNKDAQCTHDPDHSIYPSMDKVVAAFRAGHEKAIETVEQADDGLFIKENPNEGMRGKFPTVGAMHAFYLGGHFMVHMGQMSAWRRMMGLGSA